MTKYRCVKQYSALFKKDFYNIQQKELFFIWCYVRETAGYTEEEAWQNLETVLKSKEEVLSTRKY